MKASKGILRKALFSVISVGSLIAVSACGQFIVIGDSTSVPPIEKTPTIGVRAAAKTDTGPTASQNLAELAQSASSQGSFKMLSQFVQAAGLTEQLAGQGPFTVFAPTDTAFAALPKGTLENLLKPKNKQKLVKFLGYHVIPGQVTSSQLTSGRVKTVEGTAVTLKVDSITNTVTVNDAKVIQADIPASNGVIHVINKVILPPN